MEPLISVIVPVYKVEQYLDECVQSIRKQTYTNLEIILVDDGSPDRCPEMCDEYARQDSRIKVIHKPNGGLSSARNAGLDIATGEYVGFVDSDDIVKPNMYETLLSAFEDEKTIFAVKCQHMQLKNDNLVPQDLWKISETHIIPPKDFLSKLVLDFFSPMVWDMLILRKHIYVRFTEGKINEDYLFNYNNGYYVEDNKLSLKLIPAELYLYRYNDSGITNDKNNLFLIHIIRNLNFMYQDARSKGKMDVAEYLYKHYATSIYALHMLMAADANLKRLYYNEFHKELLNIDWSNIYKQWGLRHKVGLALALYFPCLLSISCVREFVIKRGMEPPHR